MVIFWEEMVESEAESVLGLELEELRRNKSLLRLPGAIFCSLPGPGAQHFPETKLSLHY